ncbi:MAG TPA: PKD domain-containing protein, partial [Thermoplasmata archaeon]|nr:PKD domain-containing protein [Thermoplasmata archaeon]
LVPSGFGGSFVVPQYGDYLQATAIGGTIWAMVTANYAVEQGTFQTDMWLFRAPENAPLTVASTVNPAVVDLGRPVTFAATTTNAAGATTFAWAFGDGGMGTGAAPSHSYAATGRYDVGVTATDSLGRTAATTVHVVVSTVLDATATATPTATDATQAVNFEATPAGGSGGYTYAWQFGDGATSTLAAPSHAYAVAGTYTVNAWVNDSGGGSVMRTVQVTVNPVPYVSVSASPAATDLSIPVRFTPTLTGGTGPFRYAWDFKDASSSTAIAPAHEYGRTGAFVVELIVTDAVKVTATATVSVTVNGLPAATAKASNPAPTTGDSVAFTASVTDGTGPFTYSWIFGDGSVSSSQNPNHVYATAGTYSVRLWVNDSVGGSSLATLAIVASVPVVSTTLATISAGVAFLAGVVVAALVLIFLARRRKKEEPPLAPPPAAEEQGPPPPRG